MGEKNNLGNILVLALGVILMLVAFAGCCFGVIPILFCDTGPVSSCEQSSLVIIIGAGLAFVLAIVLVALALRRMNK